MTVDSLTRGVCRLAWTLAVATLAPRAAFAMQPLSRFLEAAQTHNVDNREASLTLAQRSWETNQARYRLLPTFAATAGYTRNQYEVAVTLPALSPTAQPRTAVITPQDQLDATLTLNVPLIDVASWRRIGGADRTEEAQRVRTAATRADVDRQVVQTYFQVVAGGAVVESAQRALAAAQDSASVAQQRMGAGLGSQLDVERAVAEVERARQTVAEGELTRALALRSLETLTGVTPSGQADALPDDLAPEGPLEDWEVRVYTTPLVRAAALDTRVAQANAEAQWYAWMPTVSASATERFTNAVGFGQSPMWAVGVSATWRADLSTYAAARALEAAQGAAAVRQERTALAQRDAIHTAWQTVRTDIIRGRAARAQVLASHDAARLAHERYANGTATQLEVVQADRDGFAADVARIQTDADLAYARALLRIDAGRPLDATGAR